jgi:hypothetical protein
MTHTSSRVARRVAAVAALAVALGAGPFVQSSAAQASGPPPSSPDASTAVTETRLFLGPTARMLPPGDGYFVLYGGLVPAFQIGVTERVSIGAGSFFGIEGNFWVTPKVQVMRRGATSASAALIQVIVPGEGSMGFAFGSVTRDTASGGVTVGIGAAFTHGWDDDDDWAAGGPLFMVGGDRRLSRRVVFVSENYIVAGNGAMLMNGIRASWTRFSLDAAATVLVGGNSLAAGPALNLSWRF